MKHQHNSSCRRSLLKELRQATLGNAERFLVIETGTDFSVRNATSVSLARREVFISRYFYGPKEDVREAQPKDRRIVHIFKEKPRLIPAFPNDPENLRLIVELEEEMSYYVYMYQLPDGFLIIYDEHFNPINSNVVKNGDSFSSSVSTSSYSCCTKLQFNLSGNLTGQAHTTTTHALNLWSEQLAGTVPVTISVMFLTMSPGVLGGSYRQPHYWDPITQTWYSSALGKQLEGGITHNLNDIRLEMNSSFSWNYSITSPPSTSQYDWLTVMLHEITHGLGFSSLLGSNGAYVYTTATGGTLNTNFPSSYDRQLFQGLTGANLPALNQSDRAALVVSNNLFSGRTGSYLLAANGGTRVKMYAPSNWAGGSSVITA